MYEMNPCCTRDGRHCQWVEIQRIGDLQIDGTWMWQYTHACSGCGVLVTSYGRERRDLSSAVGSTCETMVDLPSAVTKIVGAL